MRKTVGVVLLLAAGCALPPRSIRTVAEPARVVTLDRKAPYLKAHLRDGGVYVLGGWRVDETARTVTGTGRKLGPDRREPGESGTFTLEIDSVALFEANTMPEESLRPTTVLAGISGVMTVGCLLVPKACFGSCPTFYVGQGADEQLQAEGFSTSIAPALEHTDVDALYLARPDDQRFTLTMRNEALETHVVRHADLLVARRPPGGRVIASMSGDLRQVLAQRSPRACNAPEGDCRAATQAFDGVERVSLTDGHDLAAREAIDLDFDLPPGAGPLGLVVGARQTLLTTYLTYQTLAYMGPSATGWMAQFERGGRDLVDRVHAVNDLLGGIEVLLPDGAGGWTSAGEVRETGPLAADVKVLPLTAGAPGRVRLRLTRGHWRLDLVALARLGETVVPERLHPAEVVRQRDGTRVEAFTRGPLTTLPGDEYAFVYRLPKNPADHELFLESRGYYLEWMRQEWMAEEDPLRVWQILANPRQALIDLAPQFKEQEPGMEKAFWESRYARPL